MIRRERDLSVSDLSSASKISARHAFEDRKRSDIAVIIDAAVDCGALNVSLSLLFAASEQRRDCSFVRAKQGVVIERRGTKVGHVYQLLGHVIGGDVVVEPYMITLKEDAEPFTGFQHAGMEFIYMLTGEVVIDTAITSTGSGPAIPSCSIPARCTALKRW